jgi:glycosyltransferase involved in cell wall biosynthesis
MQRINILYVITKMELGGAQKQLLSLLDHLDKEKFSPFLFTAKKGELFPEALSISGIKIRRSIFLDRPINPLKDILALIEICLFIKKNDIAVVHTHSSKAGILGRLAAGLAKTRVIIHTVHGWSFNDCQPVIFRKLFIWLERFTARFTDRLIVVSAHDKEKGLRNRIGSENKYVLIRYGIDYAEFGQAGRDIKEELGIGTGYLTVGMVSCLKPQKSPQDFIRLAFNINQALANVKFILVGDGALRRNIERLIIKFNLAQQVILTGWRRDIADILSAIDVFVLTSLWEGLPVAALEALSSSKPVVATNTGGISEVVADGENGFLTPPGEPKKMCEKLTVLLKDAVLRKKMSENARETLTYDFCLESMVKTTQDLYADLIFKPRGINAYH